MPSKKGKGGKNQRRGKKDGELDKRELIFKEDGQGESQVINGACLAKGAYPDSNRLGYHLG